MGLSVPGASVGVGGQGQGAHASSGHPNPLSGAAAAAAAASKKRSNEVKIDLGSWARELLQHLQATATSSGAPASAGNNSQAYNEAQALEVTVQLLSAFENQVVSAISTKRNSLAHANRILVKTLQRMHKQHKNLVEVEVPGLRKELEAAQRLAQQANSRAQVLEMHLNQALKG